MKVAILNLIRQEPALVTAVIVGILVLLVAFGVPIDPSQHEAILGLAGAVLALVQGLITRAAVTPNAKVAARTDNGDIVSGPADAVSPDGTSVAVVPAVTPTEYIGAHRTMTPDPVDSLEG